MSDLDFNYAALIALILDPELGYTKALKDMGIYTKIEFDDDVYEARRKLKDTDIEGIKYLYEVIKLKISEIAKLYEVTDVTVGNFMKKHNIQARKKGNRGV